MKGSELADFKWRKAVADKAVVFGVVLWAIGFILSASGIVGEIRLTPAAIVLIIFESALNLSPIPMPHAQVAALGIIIVFGFLSGTVIAFSTLSNPQNIILYSIATGVISGFLAITVTAIQVFTTTPQYSIILFSGLAIIPVLTVPISVVSSIISARVFNMIF